jgi:hypothetical protein
MQNWSALLPFATPSRGRARFRVSGLTESWQVQQSDSLPGELQRRTSASNPYFTLRRKLIKDASSN